MDWTTHGSHCARHVSALHACTCSTHAEQAAHASKFVHQLTAIHLGLPPSGHIASWEVEKMAKDFGWVMQAQVCWNPCLLILGGHTRRWEFCVESAHKPFPVQYWHIWISELYLENSFGAFASGLLIKLTCRRRVLVRISLMLTLCRWSWRVGAIDAAVIALEYAGQSGQRGW